MKLKELKAILYSDTGFMHWAVVWDDTKKETIIEGCSVDYAVSNYGEREVERLYADNNYLVISVK